MILAKSEGPSCGWSRHLLTMAFLMLQIVWGIFLFGGESPGEGVRGLLAKSEAKAREFYNSLPYTVTLKFGLGGKEGSRVKVFCAENTEGIVATRVETDFGQYTENLLSIKGEYWIVHKKFAIKEVFPVEERLRQPSMVSVLIPKPIFPQDSGWKVKPGVLRGIDTIMVDERLPAPQQRNPNRLAVRRHILNAADHQLLGITDYSESGALLNYLYIESAEHHISGADRSLLDPPSETRMKIRVARTGAESLKIFQEESRK